MACAMLFIQRSNNIKDLNSFTWDYIVSDDSLLDYVAHDVCTFGISGVFVGFYEIYFIWELKQIVSLFSSMEILVLKNASFS